jgi:hypothetical protein
MKYPKEIWCKHCNAITEHIPKMDAVKNGNLVCNNCRSENNFNNMKDTPDNWVVIKFETPSGEIFYKVFASWIGGYLDGDYWRLNSGIVKIEEDDESYMFIGASGSRYHCFKNQYGKGTSYHQGVLSNLIEQGKTKNVVMTVLNQDTDYNKLILL